MSAAVNLLSQLLLAVAVICMLLESSANAHDKLKIGIITTLSAAAGAVPGQQQRNGFELAIKALGGKLGGREAEILVADDELKPDVAVAKVKALVDRDALRAALKKAEFKSVRGAFKFNNNHYPIQDIYLTKVGKRPDGRYETEIVKKVFTNYGDSYAKDCPMK
jgi:ABC-type branched-subunit amino acid transport system substrate-binding protein